MTDWDSMPFRQLLNAARAKAAEEDFDASVLVTTDDLRNYLNGHFVEEIRDQPEADSHITAEPEPADGGMLADAEVLVVEPDPEEVLLQELSLREACDLWAREQDTLGEKHRACLSRALWRILDYDGRLAERFGYEPSGFDDIEISIIDEPTNHPRLSRVESISLSGVPVARIIVGAGDDPSAQHSLKMSAIKRR